MNRNTGKTRRMFDQVIDWCRNMEPVPKDKTCPTVAVLVANDSVRAYLQYQFIKRAADRGIPARDQIDHHVHLNAGNRKECTVKFMTVKEATEPWHLSGRNIQHSFVDHFAVETQLVKALKPFGTAFKDVDVLGAIERATEALLPDQYKDDE